MRFTHMQQKFKRGKVINVTTRIGRVEDGTTTMFHILGISTQETPPSLCKSGYFLETEPRGWWTWPHQQAVHHSPRDGSCGSVRPSQNERSGTLSLALGVMCNAGPTIWTQLLSRNRWEKSQPYCQCLAVQPTAKGFTKWGTLWWYISSFFTLKLLTLLVYESLIEKLFNSRDHD